jgi:hypothetical protein
MLTEKQAIAIGVVSLVVLFTAFSPYAEPVRDFFGLGTIPDEDVDVDVDAEFSRFEISPLKKDDSSTSVTSATLRVWRDSNGDGKMQYSELGKFTESSGTYTTKREYPIGEDYKFWIQEQASNYDINYVQVYMTGQKNSDGSAKPVVVAQGSEDMVFTDSSVTYDGLINGKAWDDSDDYNYTANGAEETAEIRIKLSGADQGITSEIWDAVNYQNVYSDLTSEYNKDFDYVVKWNEISDEGISKFYAPRFLSIWFTEQDSIDFGNPSSDFDGHYYGPTNRYFFSINSVDWDNMFYYSADSSRTVTYSFDADIDAAGAAVYVGIVDGLEYDSMVEGDYTNSDIIGTEGADWDWTA